MIFRTTAKLKLIFWDPGEGLDKTSGSPGWPNPGRRQGQDYRLEQKQGWELQIKYLLSTWMQ